MFAIGVKLLMALPTVVLLTHAHVHANAGNREPQAAKAPSEVYTEGAAAELTRPQIAEARRHFEVEVLAFETSKRHGSHAPYSDHVRLRVTNHSNVTLPYITPLTKRYSRGNAIGWSRAPAMPVHDLKPGASKIFDYYPHGHISAFPVDKVTVEIEQALDEEEVRFFIEFQPSPLSGRSTNQLKGDCAASRRKAAIAGPSHSLNDLVNPQQ